MNLIDAINSVVGSDAENFAWAKVKSVSEEDATMVCEGLNDQVEYPVCMMGLGNTMTVPKIDSRVILLVLDEGTLCLQIYAEEVEKVFVNGDAFGGMVNAKELKLQLDKNTALLQSIQNAFSNWVPAGNDGGAALKAQSNSFISLQRADLSDIESETIYHG